MWMLTHLIKNGVMNIPGISAYNRVSSCSFIKIQRCPGRLPLGLLLVGPRYWEQLRLHVSFQSLGFNKVG
jgi:hypothetical protein